MLTVTIWGYICLAPAIFKLLAMEKLWKAEIRIFLDSAPIYHRLTLVASKCLFYSEYILNIWLQIAYFSTKISKPSILIYEPSGVGRYHIGWIILMVIFLLSICPWSQKMGDSSTAVVSFSPLSAISYKCNVATGKKVNVRFSINNPQVWVGRQ